MTIKQSFKTGLSFGLTSGIITTLGLVVGLSSGTQSKLVVLSGILVIAIADSFSDALGIHISEESDKRSQGREIWEATLATFLSKLLVALTFIIPVLFLPLTFAIVASIFWGLLLISIFSFYLAKEKGEKIGGVILEHLSIAILVVFITHFFGRWLASFN